MLDFSSVSHTGSRHVPGHSVVHRDYPSRGRNRYTSPTSRVRVPRIVTRLVAPLVVDYFTYAMRPGASARRVARRRLLRLAQARHQLLHLRRASGCLGLLCGSSRGSSSTTSPRAGSSSTTSPTPCVRVPRHVARLVVPFIVNFDYAAHLGASARHKARHAARRRLLRLYRASGCLGSSHGSSRRSSSTTSPTPCVWVPQLVTWFVVPLVVDYFTYATHPGASARRAARRAARRRLLRLAQARRKLLHLRRASGCLGSSRRSSSTTSSRAGSSSTTSPTPRIRVPRHIARLVSLLVVDYFAYAARPGASTRDTARHVAHRRLLRAPRLHLAATLALLQPHLALRVLVSRQHWLYFEYSARCRDVAFQSHRFDHSSRLVFQTSRQRQSRPQQLVRINSN
jgi:hypothetical protein